jgi:hypothetical protein
MEAIERTKMDLILKILNHPNTPEPPKFVDRYLKLGIEYETPEHIEWNIIKQHYVNIISVPKEKRQDILNCFKQGGISIKEVAEKFDLDSEVVGDIILVNIKQSSYLGSETV